MARKSEDLRRLETEHEHNLARLRELNNQMDGQRQQELHSKGEKRIMEEELENLTAERNDLVRRMNELSEKYEDYVRTMNQERADIMRANKQHVKLLTAKLFWQILTAGVQQRRKQALQEMMRCADKLKHME